MLQAFQFSRKTRLSWEFLTCKKLGEVFQAPQSPFFQQKHASLANLTFVSFVLCVLTNFSKPNLSVCVLDFASLANLTCASLTFCVLEVTSFGCAGPVPPCPTPNTLPYPRGIIYSPLISYPQNPFNRTSSICQRPVKWAQARPGPTTSGGGLPGLGRALAALPLRLWARAGPGSI